MTLKIKDWLKERSDKTQFKVLASIDGKATIVTRNSDKLAFALGTNKLTSETIVKFHEDLIHVTISALVFNSETFETLRQEAIFEINWLGKYQSMSYGKKDFEFETSIG